MGVRKGAPPLASRPLFVPAAWASPPSENFANFFAHILAELPGARELGSHLKPQDAARAARAMGKQARKRKRKEAQRKINRQQYRARKPQRSYGASDLIGGEGDATPSRKRARPAALPSVLVLGDGDFTFTRGLVRRRHGGKGVVGTSFDSRTAVLRKYPNSETVLAEIARGKARILHGIDARALHTGPLRSELFDRIVFNFPHSGQQRVHVNRALLRDFFSSATRVLSPGGEIHVTLRDRPPYSNWQVELQASAAGLTVASNRMFDPSQFPGYAHRTTLADAEAFDFRFCRTRVFRVVSAARGSKRSRREQTIDDGSKADELSESDEDVSPVSDQLFEVFAAAAPTRVPGWLEDASLGQRSDTRSRSRRHPQLDEEIPGQDSGRSKRPRNATAVEPSPHRSKANTHSLLVAQFEKLRKGKKRRSLPLDRGDVPMAPASRLKRSKYGGPVSTSEG